MSMPETYDPMREVRTLLEEHGEKTRLNVLDSVNEVLREITGGPPKRGPIDFSNPSDRLGGSTSTYKPSDPLPSYGSAARAKPGWEREYQIAAYQEQWSDKEKRIRTPEADYETCQFFQAVIDGDQARLREIEANQNRSEFERAISTTSGGAGMITVGFSNQVQLLSERVAKMRQLVNVTVTSDTSIKVPTVTTQPVPAVFAEGADMSGGTDPGIGSVTLTPVKIGQIIRVSRELVQDSPLATSRVLAQLVAEAIGNAEDQHILDGALTDFTGNLFDNSTASADTWDDDAETLATIASKLYELPIDAITNASILINIDAAKALAAVTGNDRQVFLPFDPAPQLLGPQEGGFGLLLGMPVRVFPTTHIPVNTCFIGNMKAYTLASREVMHVEADRGAFFSTDEIGLHISRRVDGTVAQATRIRKYPAV